VVQIFDYGVDEGVPYIAMEMLQGESLGERLERDATITPEFLAKVFTDVTRGLGRAHELGIIHRDLKPDNIFVVREAEEEIIKVLDFGIAKVSEGSLTGSSGSGTRTGAMLGTPYYMSPEQARGNKTVDHRTDLWAMAVIAFECLTGRRPFESDALGDMVLQICTEDPPIPSSLAQVPEGFDSWFVRATQKDPEARFQSLREMSSALAEALASARIGTASELARAATMVHTPQARMATDASLGRTTNGQAAAEIEIPKTSALGGRWIALAAIFASILVAGTLWFSRSSPSEDESASTEGSAARAAAGAPFTPADTDEERTDEATRSAEAETAARAAEVAPAKPELDEKKDEDESSNKRVETRKTKSAPPPAQTPSIARTRPASSPRVAPAPAPAPHPAPAPAAGGADLFSDRQ
jgi:serine/threonine-protein kinase